MKILERINSPEDLRKLARDDIKKVSDELRAFLLESVSKGGVIYLLILELLN